MENLLESFCFKKALPVWVSADECKNDWVSVRNKLSYVSGNVRLNISAETRYFLYVNGKAAVHDGGLFAPDTESAYVDTVDITPMLGVGENVIEILCWHYGNGGRNNVTKPRGYVIYESDDCQLFSGDHTECVRDVRFFESTEGDQPSYLYGGYNICFDARKECGEYGAAVVVEGAMRYFKRPTPMLKSNIFPSAEFTRSGDKYTVSLSYATHVLPSFTVEAAGGEVIDIRGNNYVTPGGPGDHYGRYNGHRCTYVCKAGKNEFTSYDWIGCEKVIFTVPESVKVESLGYVESVYDTDAVGIMETDDHLLNRLLKKCVRTLKFCMRDNFMDCPDRERGQWIGDVSVQAHQVFYTLDENAAKLLKKAINDFITLRKGDRLVGNVPGENFSELPSQSLNAISRLGMISEYYQATADKDVLKLAFEPSVRYLMLWKADDDGVILSRTGDWAWIDHLYNIDKTVCEICWYYSAICFMLDVAEQLGDSRFNGFLSERKAAIEKTFNGRYWKGKYYASGDVVDDRANALAVLVGLADSKKYIYVRDVLISVFSSSTYMEGYAIDALCLMGYKELAYKRLMSRYYNLTVNESSTLWEDFYILGTKNHAWTGAPLTTVYRWFLGLKTDIKNGTVTVDPDFSVIKRYSCKVRFNGDTYSVYADEKETRIEKITV